MLSITANNVLYNYDMTSCYLNNWTYKPVWPVYYSNWSSSWNNQYFGATQPSIIKRPSLNLSVEQLLAGSDWWNMLNIDNQLSFYQDYATKKLVCGFGSIYAPWFCSSYMKATIVRVFVGWHFLCLESNQKLETISRFEINSLHLFSILQLHVALEGEVYHY